MYKQVIVMRKDLKMRRGKEIAQGAHASMIFLSHIVQHYMMSKVIGTPIIPFAVESWLKGSFAKICLQVNSEAELDEIAKKAGEAGLIVHVVTDAGKTEFNGVPTKTCLAIGPASAEEIDKITGHLSLY